MPMLNVRVAAIVRAMPSHMCIYIEHTATLFLRPAVELAATLSVRTATELAAALSWRTAIEPVAALSMPI